MLTGCRRRSLALPVSLLYAIMFLECRGVRCGWNDLRPRVVQRWIACGKLCRSILAISASMGLRGDFDSVDHRKHFSTAGVRGRPAVVRGGVCAIVCVDDWQGRVAAVDSCVAGVVCRRQHPCGQRGKCRCSGRVVGRLRGTRGSLDQAVTSRGHKHSGRHGSTIMTEGRQSCCSCMQPACDWWQHYTCLGKIMD